MKNAYIVLEGEENASALQEIFPTDQWKGIEILGAKYRSTAISIAGTLMSDRSRPVLLIVDAKSTKPEDIREETQTVEQLLLRCATDEPYKVISAVPSIAALIQEITTTPDRKQHPLLQQINQFLTESLIPVA